MSYETAIKAFNVARTTTRRPLNPINAHYKDQTSFSSSHLFVLPLDVHKSVCHSQIRLQIRDSHDGAGVDERIVRISLHVAYRHDTQSAFVGCSYIISTKQQSRPSNPRQESKVVELSATRLKANVFVDSIQAVLIDSEHVVDGETDRLNRKHGVDVA